MCIRDRLRAMVIPSPVPSISLVRESDARANGSKILAVHAWDVVLIFITVLAVGFLSVWYPVRYLSKRLL